MIMTKGNTFVRIIYILFLKVRLIKVIVAFLSMTGSVFVAATIFYSKKLQAHPQPLIAYICMCEAISSFNAMMQSVNPKTFAGYFKLDQLFSYTIAFNFSPYDLYDDESDYLNKY